MIEEWKNETQTRKKITYEQMNQLELLVKMRTFCLSRGETVTEGNYHDTITQYAVVRSRRSNTQYIISPRNNQILAYNKYINHN